MRNDTKLDVLWNELEDIKKSGGGGSDLPEVTEADNGKLLGVVNGAWNKMDAPSGGVDYSTTEQNTGRKWIDGETIYQKTYSISNINNSNTLIDANLSQDKVNVVNFEYNRVEALTPYNNENFICGHTSATMFLRVWAKSDGLFANLEGATSNYACNAIITVYYTKITPTKSKKKTTKNKED